MGLRPTRKGERLVLSTQDDKPKRGLVLQRPLSELPQSQRPVYGKWGTPDTVVIPPNAKKLAKFPRSEIFAESLARGRFIPSPTVELWGLREGDLILYREPPDRSSSRSDNEEEVPPDPITQIISVNGETDAAVVRNWPTLVAKPDEEDQNKIFGRYPNKPLPLDYFDRRVSWDEEYEPVLGIIFRGGWPLGEGHGLWIAGPGGVGKTMNLRAIFRAAMLMMEEDQYSDFHLMACIAGEREEDYTDLSDDMLFMGHLEDPRVELYAAPEGVTPMFAWVQMGEFFIKRARRLTASGKRVIAIKTSGTKVVQGHSRSPVFRTEGDFKTEGQPWIPGAISVQSIAFGTELLAIKGQYRDSRPNGDGKERSLTLIVDVLYEQGGEQTTEAYFAREKMLSLSTLLWLFTDNPLADHPKINVGRSKCRKLKNLTTSDQYDEIKRVKAVYWNGNEATNRWVFAQKDLIRETRDKPITYYAEELGLGRPAPARPAAVAES